MFRTAKSITYNVLKYGTAVSLGVIGGGVAIGTKATSSMDSAIESCADSLYMTVLSSLPDSRSAYNSSPSQSKKKQRSKNFDWIPVSAKSSGYEYSR